MITKTLRRAVGTLTHPHSLDQVGAALRRSWTSESIGTVTDVTPLTARASSITMRTNASWPGHIAGQFVPVSVEVNGRRETRTYSLTTPTSSPGVQTISIGVQRVPDGIVSNALNDRVSRGSILHLGAPAGEFTLPSTVPDAGLLLIAAGSGATPVRGLLAELIARRTRSGAAHDVTVLSFAQSDDDRMFGTEFAEMASRHPWLNVRTINNSRDAATLTRLDADLLDEHCPTWRQRRTYACGPTGLLDDLEATFAAEAIRDRLAIERFTRTFAPLNGIATTARVSVTLDNAGAKLSLPTDAPLLDTIEQAGQLAPSGCRNGICHTCSVEVLDGCARNLRDGRITEAGSFVQLCINAPLTELTLAL